ncbi:RHS repeat-associated protein [Burkholderia sp. PvR073]|uniref:contractile injection system protein, VgrG/Pvc8 family n=1 Tax=Burkholderia ambifaria TaxID=152480 RepID=UPI0033954E6B
MARQRSAQGALAQWITGRQSYFLEVPGAPRAQDLSIMSFALDERLGEPYRIDLTLTSPAPLARTDYLNRPAIFTIEPAGADGAVDAQRTFAGCITAFGQIRKTRDFVSYRIVVEPFVARLRLVETSRIYQQQSVPEIIESILRRHEFRSHQFSFKLRRAYPRLAFRMQYRMSDWDYIRLLMEQTGLFCFFRAGQHGDELHFGDDVDAYRAPQVVREDPDDAYSVPVAQRVHTFGERRQWQGASLYLHEPGTFVPLARLDETLVEAAFIATGTDGGFVQVPAKTRHATLFYQNDHLGTPQELLDDAGKVVWLGRYRAWGGEKTVWREKPERNEVGNAIRFQGQHHDEETGLHYNRYRYYDPQSGRFVSKDPIGLQGGLNVYQYAANPIEWVDPFGLSKAPGTAGRKQVSSKANQNAKCPCRGKWEVNHFDRICSGNVPGVGYAKYVRDPSTGMWWSEDQTGHGNSAWKLYDKNGAWVADADVYGDFMNKHKSDTGKRVDFDSLKCKESK